jgi:hypothetical protein
MGDIYKAARWVTVWLGPEREDSDLAMELVTDPTRPLNQKQRGEDVSDKEMEWISTTIGDGLFEKHWIALKAIYQRLYWSRIWIVAKLVSNISVRVHCGSKSAEFCSFIILGINIYHNGFLRNSRELQAAFQMQLALEVASAIPRLHFALDQLEGGNSDFSGHSLRDLLSHYGYQECTDPRDKAYALLGLCSAIDVSEDVVRYDAPVCWVYALAVHLIIQESGIIGRVLSNAHYSNRSLFTLPT